MSSESRYNVTAEDILKYPWESAIEGATRNTCTEFHAKFFTRAQELKDQDDDLGARVHSLLGAVSSYHANFDVHGNPYGPLWRSEGQRALCPDDLSESDLEALAGILDTIKSAELRARVGDVLWECKRNHKAARIAVEAFQETARLQETEDLWPPMVERLERSVKLAALLGYGKELHLNAVANLRSYIEKYRGNLKSGLLCNHLIGILYAQDQADLKADAAICEELARAFQTSGEFDFSHTYWEQAARLHKDAKSEDLARNALLKAAECYHQKAENQDNAKKFGNSYAAHWMGAALEAYRKAGAPEDVKKQVHLRLLELEGFARDELSPLTMDAATQERFREGVNKAREQAQQHVSGHEFPLALFRLAEMLPPQSPQKIREELLKQSKEFVFMHIGGTAVLTESGQTAGTIGPMPMTAGEGLDEWLLKSSYLHARQLLWPHMAGLFIEPARLQLRKEHPVRLRDLVFLVANNPFIPEGHEGIYLKGIQAGFFGDWLTASHLLIPQIEASLRFVCQQQGIVTSTLESDGTQKERDLGWLLYDCGPTLIDIFGEDLAFDLRGILFEKFGCNLRNDMAHGLISEGGFYSPAAEYLWWIVLKLCCHGHRCLLEQRKSPQES